MNLYSYSDQNVLFSLEKLITRIDIAQIQFEWVIISICYWLNLEINFADPVISYSLTSLLNASNTRHTCCEQLLIFNLFQNLTVS